MVEKYSSSEVLSFAPGEWSDEIIHQMRLRFGAPKEVDLPLDLAPERPTWTIDEILRRRDSSYLLSLTRLKSDSSAGLMGFALVQVYDAGFEILYIWMEPQNRRRGGGKALLLKIHDLLRLSKVGTLQVSEANLAAVYLYENCGYQVLRKLERYYRDGMSALEMQIQL